MDSEPLWHAVKGVHGVVLVDKPVGCSSHDVVRWCRRVFGTRTVGHGGTLDPRASGLLAVGVGGGTRILRVLTGQSKVYRVVVSLGTETDTLDGEGQVVKEGPVFTPCPNALRKVLTGLLGWRRQVPPAVSAIKVDGVAAHKRVRRGEEVRLCGRMVCLERVTIEPTGPCDGTAGVFPKGHITLLLHTSPGYYVRSFARDLARDLGTVGHVAELRRVSSGGFHADGGVDGDALQRAFQGDEGERQRVRGQLTSLWEVWGDGACRVLTGSEVVDVLHGRSIPMGTLRDGREWASGAPGFVGLFDDNRRMVAMGELREGQIHVARGAVEVCLPGSPKTSRS